MEVGETCDCGTDNCVTAGDKCCDGTICGLYAFASCSNIDDCCEDCEYKSANTLCRAQNTSNSCDIDAEYCTGTSSECPTDFKEIEGTKCYNSEEEDTTNIGYCYKGECVTMMDQCTSVADSYIVAPDDTCGYTPFWQVRSDSCAIYGPGGLQCYDTNPWYDSEVCEWGRKPAVGTPLFTRYSCCNDFRTQNEPTRVKPKFSNFDIGFTPHQQPKGAP